MRLRIGTPRLWNAGVGLAAMLIGACLLPVDALGQERGGTEYDFSGSVSTDAAVLVCTKDCGSTEVAVSIPLDQLELVGRSWQGLRSSLRWSGLPSAANHRPPAARASCAALTSAFADVNSELRNAERTVERIRATGYFFAVDSQSPNTRITRRDPQFERTVDRWIAGHREAFAIATQIVQTWNQRGCA